MSSFRLNHFPFLVQLSVYWFWTPTLPLTTVYKCLWFNFFSQKKNKTSTRNYRGKGPIQPRQLTGTNAQHRQKNPPVGGAGKEKPVWTHKALCKILTRGDKFPPRGE